MRDYTVFISHSSKDRFGARQIARMIEERGHGLRTFVDEKDIEYGGSIPDSIRQAIRECGELVEIGAAWVLEKRIVTVVDKVPLDQMPDVLAPHRVVDLNEVEDYIEQLVERVKEAGEA